MSNQRNSGCLDCSWLYQRSTGNLYLRKVVLCLSGFTLVSLMLGLVELQIRTSLPVTQPEPERLSVMQSYLQELADRQATVPKDRLQSKVRILCLILTTEDSLKSRGAAINATWAMRCNRYFYVLNTAKHAADIINTKFGETRNNIVHKVKFALNHIYEHYIDEFDWLLKADDDTYVIMENLRFLLQKHNSNTPGYLGFHFNKFVDGGYMSGGAGYVISNRALRRLVDFGFNSGLCPIVPNEHDPENSEDIEMGRCLNITGVGVISSLDTNGRETFHPYPMQQHLFGAIPQYLFNWTMHRHKQGIECCSRFSISFHYMDPETMLLVDHLLYRTEVWGHNDIMR